MLINAKLCTGNDFYLRIEAFLPTNPRSAVQIHIITWQHMEEKDSKWVALIYTKTAYSWSSGTVKEQEGLGRTYLLTNLYRQPYIPSWSAKMLKDEARYPLQAALSTSEAPGSGLRLARTENEPANLSGNVPPEQMIQRKSLTWFFWEIMGIPAQLEGYCAYLDKLHNGKKGLQETKDQSRNCMLCSGEGTVNLHITSCYMYIITTTPSHFQHEEGQRITSVRADGFIVTITICFPCQDCSAYRVD